MSLAALRRELPRGDRVGVENPSLCHRRRPGNAACELRID
jgi:hypothetical protein